MSVFFRHFAQLFTTSSNPSGTAVGDLWWRGDLSQMHGSDGASSPLTLGPTGNLPVIRSASWHNLPAQGAVSTVSPPADRLFALPLWPGRSGALTAAAVNVTVALDGGSVRMGMYASDGTLPTTLVADYGTVTVEVTGVRQISGLSTPLRPVLQYLVFARQGGILTLTLAAKDTGDPMVSGTSPVLDAAHTAYYIDGVSGALPASFGTPSGTIQGPSAAIQIT